MLTRLANKVTPYTEKGTAPKKRPAVINCDINGPADWRWNEWAASGWQRSSWDLDAGWQQESAAVAGGGSSSSGSQLPPAPPVAAGLTGSAELGLQPRNYGTADLQLHRICGDGSSGMLKNTEVAADVARQAAEDQAAQVATQASSAGGPSGSSSTAPPVIRRAVDNRALREMWADMEDTADFD